MPVVQLDVTDKQINFALGIHCPCVRRTGEKAVERLVPSSRLCEPGENAIELPPSVAHAELTGLRQQAVDVR